MARWTANRMIGYYQGLWFHLGAGIAHEKESLSLLNTPQKLSWVCFFSDEITYHRDHRTKHLEDGITWVLPGMYLHLLVGDHQSCQSSLARSGNFSLPAAVKPWGVCIQLVDLWWSFCAQDILQAQVIDRKVGKLVINISWLVVYLPLWKILVSWDYYSQYMEK